MKKFDLKIANNDAAFYRTDGRLFDITESNERLDLVARQMGFTGDSRLDSFLFQFFLLFSFISLSYFLVSSSFHAWQRVLVIIAFTYPFLQFLLRLLPFRAFYTSSFLCISRKWVFDKPENYLSADRRKAAPLSAISQVRAFEHGGRMNLVLSLHDGREFKISGWSKEWAWRQDAAQIADFLQVPLEIPSVFSDSMDG